MRASLFFVALAATRMAACTDGMPIGPVPDLGPIDFGTDFGTDAGDAGPRDGGGMDASHDASIDAPHDLGHDLGPIDFGRPCEVFDGGGTDLGPLPDLGPFVAPDLDGAVRPDFGVEPPGYRNGCLQLTLCLAPPDAGLTWDNFARDWFATYCTRCHSSTLLPDDAGTRHGAPPGYNWDVRAAVMAQLRTIRTDVGVANYMPVDDPALVPCERRRQLVTWIDEGAP